MEELHVDFETRSEIELPDVGLDNYSKHPSTSPWCMGYAFGDEDIQLWAAWEELPDRVVEHVYEGRPVFAHNAPFELAIWNNILVPRYGAPALIPSSVTCTMALAYAMALPGALEHAAPALGLTVTKDALGHRVMLQMARPRTRDPVTWWDDPDKLRVLYAYCKQDVLVERQLHRRLMALSPYERRVWALDYEINKRGVMLDVPAAHAAIKVVRVEQDRLNGELQKLTGNVVEKTTQTAQLTKWIREQGVEIDGLAKADINDALELDNLPVNVRQVMQVRQEAGRASVAKLIAMIAAVSADGRLRNTLQYWGAATGRWAGRRVQLHNLPRPTIHDQRLIDLAFEITMGYAPEEISYALEYVLGKPASEVLVNMLRGMFIAAPGHRLVAGDFANVEGRVLAWRAGEEWKLKAFREYDAGIGPDLYRLTYARSFGIPLESVTSDNRQVGKVEELALGYQGGVGAFQTMAKAYNVKISDEQAEEVKVGWRKAHPATVQYWWDLEAAAIGACLHPGRQFKVGAAGRESVFLKNGSFLWCKLASGRLLCYPYPEIRQVQTPWGATKDQLTYKTVPSQNTKLVADATNTSRWARVSSYGGKLAENIAQADSRDLLADAMLRIDAAKIAIVMHIHDEAVTEQPISGNPAAQVEQLERIMTETPAWATGLPIAVKAWHGKRFRKD